MSTYPDDEKRNEWRACYIAALLAIACRPDTPQSARNRINEDAQVILLALENPPRLPRLEDYA